MSRIPELAARLAVRHPAPIEDSDRPRAAVAVVLAPDPDSVLLIRRADREGDRWSGHLAFPGGRWSPGDAGLVDTARRETLEEVGLDLTRDGRYGLSQAAIDTVASLDRPLVARVFFSEGLDAPYHDHRRALLDLLDELAARSGGRMDVVATDPSGDPQLRAEAQRLGVRPIPYMARPSADRTETRTVYMGLALLYGERRIAIDAMPSVERMEVDVISAIRRLATPTEEQRSVAWLLGHGEPDPASFPADHPLQAFVHRMREAGTFRTLALGDAPVPDDEPHGLRSRM